MEEFGESIPVIIFAPGFYRERRIGLTSGKCRDHEGAIRVLVLDHDAPIKEVCVGIDPRDTIERLPLITDSPL